MKIKKSYECMNACILNHMNRAGIKISGSDIFFSGGGYFISYKKGSLTRIKSEAYDANFRFLQKYKIDYRFGRVFPSKDLLINFLQQPYTITIRMVSDFLRYDRVFSQTSGASHFINIIDYDGEKKMFLIVDGDVPSMETGYFSGWVDEDDVLRGWQVMQGEVLQMKLPSQVSELDLYQHIRKEANVQVRNAIQKYLEVDRTLFSGKITGQRALYFMIHQLGKYAGKSGFRELTQEANFRIRVDGYLGAKNFMLEKIKEQKKMDILKEYEELIKNWSKWCMLLLKSGLTGGKNNFMIVEERMKELIKREQMILEKVVL